VAISDCTVPFRADHGLQPLDLMNSGQLRSGYTDSLSDIIWAIDF
jgi:hypothetical protein